MNRQYEMIKDFYKAAGVGANEYPISIPHDSRSRYSTLLIKDIMEFNEAWDLTRQARSIIQLIHGAVEVLVNMGVEPDELLQLVHDKERALEWNRRVKTEHMDELYMEEIDLDVEIQAIIASRITGYITAQEEMKNQPGLPFYEDE